MIPEKMVLKGFMSFKDRIEVEFHPGVTAVFGHVHGGSREFGDSNGSGKTSLVTHALSWLLYGRIPSGERTNDLIHWDCSQVYGEIVFRGRGGYLKIERAKSRTSSEDIRFFWNSEEVHIDAIQAQKKLEEIIGMPREVFHNAHVISQNSDSAKFATATPGERAKLLSRMLPYDELFQKAGGLVQKDITRNEGEKALQAGVLDQMRRELGRLQANLVRAQENAAHESLRFQQERKQRQQRISELEEELARQVHVLREPAPTSVGELQVQKNQAQALLQALQVRIGQSQAILAARDLGEGTICPSCYQSVTGAVVAHLREEKAKAERIRQDAVAQVQQQNAVILGIDLKIQKSLTHAQQVRYAQAAVERLEEDIKSLRFQQEEKPQSAFSREAEILTAQIRELEGQIKMREAEVAALESHIPVLRKLAQGFQQDIRNMSLDDTRRILAHYAEKYRWLLYGDSLRFEFPDTTATGREKFEILLKSGDTQNKIPSTGQQYRMGLALILALRRVLLFGNRTPFDFIVLDDPVGELDATGVKVLYKLMSNLTEEIPMVITTVPQKIPDLQVENEIWVEYDGRNSRIGGAPCLI